MPSGKIVIFEYLTGEGILPSDQIRITEQTKCTHSPLGKAVEKLKTVEGQCAKNK